ncbi:type III-B CRISPR-associated protein Cas10/Cmr2 [Hazenella sp. IB182353]|uniref:type III-B CRISPR-associated protein Cas10/Cmr2 n=1 Tax=Polycladospora coralii TaxID=2771432 RepID=UPI0017463082|nr:type III-B CRISPR-associated protein Cas10/Cmr2 [Polycladospora coralii]MBS7530235.1 type III-B CRISPR-associated protein Cas10/Cmr2 [Polycladospora coralii]
MNQFQFTIGPVQGFVTQSRRTRDLLISSFLLSYLSGHAIKNVVDQEGQILFPKVEKVDGKWNQKLLTAIEQGEGDVYIGTIPNRFTAEVPHSFDPAKCVETVQAAWKKIAVAVWDVYIKDIVTCGNQTKEIWDRQVEHMWEIDWVLGDDPDLLSSRKAWRTHIPTIEEGDKCTLMPHLQEISGYARPNDRKKQHTFWQELRRNHRLPAHEIRDSERLSAIGLIKRLFPHVSKQAIKWQLPKKAIVFPSKSDMAVMPWRGLAHGGIEKEHFVQVLQQAQNKNKSPQIDGFERKYFLRNEWEKLLRDRGQNQGNVDRKTIQTAYDQLVNKKVDGQELGEPSPYFAIVVMDGDGLGNLLFEAQQRGEAESRAVSEAVADFSENVSELVAAHKGVTIYAGGDDVLALFPKDRALAAATALKDLYQKRFEAINARFKEHVTSLSGAIVYGHHLTHMQALLQYGHYLLDDVAKAKTGRDSLAIGIWKRSGPVVEWSAPWDHIEKPSEDGKSLLVLIDEIKQDPANAFFSNQFLFKLESVFQSFADQYTDRQVLLDLITAEYMRIMQRDVSVKSEGVKKKVKQLLDFSYQMIRNEKKEVVPTGVFQTEIAMLLRFLAMEERD